MAPRHVSTFLAAGEDGSDYAIDVFEDSWPGKDLSPFDIRTFRAANGMSVVRLNQGEYFILPLGVVVHSADPTAP